MIRQSGAHGLTAYDLQTELCNYLTTLFEGTLFKTTKGEERPPKIFRQALPIPEDDYDADITEAPYIIVQLDSGEIADFDTGDTAESVRVLLIFGVYDPDPMRTGYLSLINMIQRVKNDFGRKRRVGNFTVESPLTWVLDDSDTHPFYFGALVASFEAARTVKEDPLA